jgi:TolB-like protein/tetratricopeptide (TPR) repeat protein
MSGEAPESRGGQQSTDPPASVEVPTASIHVFISYASQDIATADAVVGALEPHGLKCWIAPRDVVPGEPYARAIVHAIDATKLMVLILSENAAASQHVLREVERASSKRHPVVAFRIDRTQMPPELEYFLNTSQWLDASTLGVDRALPKLVDAVQRAIAPASVASPEYTGIAPKPVARLSEQSSGSKHAWVALGVVVALGLAYFAVDKLWLGRRSTMETSTTAATTTVNEKSIAVLPFVDMSEKHDQEYFADGMAEEIIDLLAQVPDLRVPARTSSFYFKGKSTPVPDIARQLGVANVLEGSIRRSGNRIRVTAQLARADNGYHLWSQTYDRDAGDVFKVQDDIANAVVQAMQITLMGGPLTRRRGGTQNLQAYQLYLRGLSSMWQVTDASLASAREYFNQALSLDPDFGLAWAELSRDTLFMVSNGGLPTREGYERARGEAQRALQISADIPEAHGMLANIYRNFDWDWTASGAEVRQALEVDPTNPTALMRGGQLSYTLGHWDEAERQLRLALVRDPLATIAIWSLGTAQYGAGRYAEAEATYRKLLEVAPGFLGARGYLGKTLLAEGKAKAALAMVQQENSGEVRQKYLPIVLRAVGRTADADAALQALVAKSAATDAYYVAMNYAYRGDHDLTFQWLERAYEQRDQGFREIVGEPLFRNVAQDARFRAFLRKMNLPE